MRYSVARKAVRTLCCVALCATASLTQLRAQSSTPDFVGYVFQITGSWRTAPQFASDLQLGQGVRQNDVIHLMTPRPDASIHIGLIDQTAGVRDCNQDAVKCREDLKIEVAGREDQGPWASLGSIWKRLTAPSRPGLLFTMSRGAESSEGDPQEAILSLRKGTPDFAPALGKVKSGAFDVTLQPSDGAPIPFKVQWAAPIAKASGPKMKSGLYRLALSSGGAAPVLILPEEQARTFIGSFDTARRLAAGWPEEMGDDARHVFLASVLEAIDRESRDSSPSAK